MLATLVYDIRNSRYLNITGRCTLRCQFCPKQQGSQQVRQYQLALDKQPKAAEIIAQLGQVSEYDEYVFCGFGEPTLNLSTLLEVAHTIKQRGGRVRLNTDGLANHFHRRNVLPELAACVDALSISLNAQDEGLYQQHCQPKLAGSWQALLTFIKLAPHYIAKVQVSAIEGLDGVDMAACRQLVEHSGCEFKHRYLDIVG
ncbi:TatD family nuclease-associated radical SAM protein [Shewanella sp. NIFS-20-20]|uniref:TatD family nuclease-associated radical SAM protein n=1 Tax=Shewanella sp. NIFS-20-20 TaxID=2853806 RepID=UPI001C48753B|nr:TatD family nuclease-associated radical SAM protein [Shewanella sp. NIFS-20-20]MBV7317250.1 TatD family nuclease-associated radical SAM protein [Shewanella sp. NIFS-20-20]